MIEFIYDAIRLSYGEEIILQVRLYDDNDEEITEGNAVLEIGNKEISGYYDDESWNFLIPSSIGLKGRQFYRVVCDNVVFNFDAPIYFVEGD